MRKTLQRMKRPKRADPAAGLQRDRGGEPRTPAPDDPTPHRTVPVRIAGRQAGRRGATTGEPAGEP